MTILYGYCLVSPDHQNPLCWYNKLCQESFPEKAFVQAALIRFDDGRSVAVANIHGEGFAFYMNKVRRSYSLPETLFVEDPRFANSAFDSQKWGQWRKEIKKWVAGQRKINLKTV